MNITIIAGARPNFMKIAPLIRAIMSQQKAGKEISYRLVYTGSNLDPRIEHSLYNDLGMTPPDVYLNVEEDDWCLRMSDILVAFAQDFKEHPTDLVMVVDDTTPAMACAIVAKKSGAKVAHLGAGIRSFDLNTPKEVNRVIIDGLSDYFFTAGMNSNRNLNNTGAEQANVYFVGNILLDNLRFNATRLKCPEVLTQLQLTNKDYLLFTLNQPSTYNNPTVLRALMESILQHTSLPILAPLHPAVIERVEALTLHAPQLHVLPAHSYLDFVYLETHARGILTDSGNVAEEATFLGVPCITFNKYVDYPETTQEGTNLQVGLDAESMQQALSSLQAGTWKESTLPERWDGRTAERIIQILEEILA